MVVTSLKKMFKSVETRFVLLLSLAFVSLPFGKDMGANIFLLLLLVNGLVGNKRNDWLRALKSPVFIISAAFYLFTVCSLLWSDNVPSGLRQLETKLTFFLGPLVLLAGVNLKVSEYKHFLLKAFMLGSFSVSIIALGIALGNSVQEGTTYYMGLDGVTKVSFFTYKKLAEPFMHPGYLATYFGTSIFIAIYFVFTTKSNVKWAYLGLVIFFFVMMFLVQGRMNLIALMIVIAGGALITAIVRKAYIWLYLPLAPVVLVVAVIVFGSDSIKARYLQLPDFSYDISGDQFNSATYRLAEWTCAADVIAENTIVGVGAGGNTKALLDSYETRKFWAGLKHKYNAHNQYLETTMTIGVIGLMLLLALLGIYGYKSWKAQDYLTLACLAFFALCMLTESMLERASAVLLFMSFFPTMIGISSFEKEKK